MCNDNLATTIFIQFSGTLLQRLLAGKFHALELRSGRAQLKNRIVLKVEGFQKIRREKSQGIKNSVGLTGDQVGKHSLFLFRIIMGDADEELIAVAGALIEKSLREETAVVTAKIRHDKPEGFAFSFPQSSCGC